MEIEVVHAKSLKSLAKLTDLSPDSTILDLKHAYRFINSKLYPERQSFRIEPKSKLLKDEDRLDTIGLGKGGKIYFKDLGPQIGWSTVFLCEYAGPLLTYLAFYPRPSFIYGISAATEPRAQVVQIAAACWTVHYTKRILETIFVHRFSNATMPLSNLFKNCSYYWGFAGFVSYFINHPLYTPPMYGNLQVYGALGGFMLCEFGNLSVHILLRNLRPAGSKVRRIPFPDSNPMNQMFNFVSCPNYTYEVGAWICFSVMTQTLPALFFTFAGFYQMAVWAAGKHRNYRKEFKDYPRGRKSIIPFLM